MAAFAGKGQKILVVALIALHPGKTVSQVAAIQIPADNVLHIRTEKSVDPFEPFLVDL